MNDSADVADVPLCPCNERTLEDAAGAVVYRYADDGKVCGNPGKPWTSGDGQQHDDGWCDGCIDKVCKWCDD